MADKSFILELGKLLIAAAWADGTLSTEEVNGLKELLFQLPDISGEEWMELELYMVSPVTEEERQRLLNRVLQRITSQTDKDLAKDVLRKLVLSGSQGADPQIEVVKRLQEDIEKIEFSFDPEFEELEEISVKPKSTDITLDVFGLAWVPYRKNAAGRLDPDWIEVAEYLKLC